jgi:stage V sporulation protein D (sporulation-specific penicillin-binding protein)
MNPNNAEVLAMASYPSFDLNNPSDITHAFTPEQLQEMSSEDQNRAKNELWRNFVIADPFEPGSTVKPFTIAAALDAGILTRYCTFYCGGMLHVGGHNINCAWQVSHGYQDLAEVMAFSCNVATMNIAMGMGTSIFSRYQEIFGFGQFTGIDLPGEVDTSGVIYSYEDMRITDLATNGFGQNFELTMMQMSVAFSSLINGGNLYAPRVVSHIQDEAGRIIEMKSPVLLRRTISDETVELNLEYMRAVMTIGTGITANVPGYEIGGKTGTAEKLPRGQGNYIISFIGYAPFDNPEVLIYVVIDEPNVEDQTNGELVRELSVRIMADIFPILGIPMIEGFVPEAVNDEDDEEGESDNGYYNNVGEYEEGWWYNPEGTSDWIFIPYEPIPWYEGDGYGY